MREGRKAGSRARRKPRVLLTGFRPFAGHAANPSERLATALAGEGVGSLEIRAVTFEVSYAGIETEFDAAVAQFAPDLLVSFGLDYGTDVVKLERLAVNLDDAMIADERGETRSGSRIAPRGPAARWATLPLEKIAASLAKSAVPFRFSAHAGTYLCNHLLYHSLRRAAAQRGGWRAGFVHLPPWPELLKSEDRERRTGMTWERQLAAGRAILEGLRTAD